MLFATSAAAGSSVSVAQVTPGAGESVRSQVKVAERFTQTLAPSARRRRAVRSPSPPDPPPPPPPPVPTTIVLTPSKDNTLYESSDGSLSNGAGIHLFAGTTATRQLRRAILAFNVASRIPAGSQITRVALTLHVSKTISGSQSMTLHRVSKDWGEGLSDAGPVRDGTGATARTGDATWIHTFRSTGFWSNPGGDFTAAPDATAVAGSFGDVTWESSAAMIARVQGWLDQPSTNFGWIVRGNETSLTTAKQFDSREVDPDATAPSLTVEYIAPP